MYSLGVQSHLDNILCRNERPKTPVKRERIKSTNVSTYQHNFDHFKNHYFIKMGPIFAERCQNIL